MADTATTTSSDAPENETPNQRTARLRREKRNAKMAATGEDRLARIKGLNGGIAPPDEALGGPVVAPTASAPKAATVHDDPEEGEIPENEPTPHPVPSAQRPTKPLPPQRMDIDKVRTNVEHERAQLTGS